MAAEVDPNRLRVPPDKLVRASARHLGGGPLPNRGRRRFLVPDALLAFAACLVQAAAGIDSDGHDGMDPTWRDLARAAGLDRAIEQFPDDVEAAAAEAFRRRGQIPAAAAPAAEPWPPMRAGDTL